MRCPGHKPAQAIRFKTLNGHMPLQISILLLCTAAAFMPILLARRFANYVANWTGRPVDDEATPKVSVLLPCKGVDPGFEENLATVFAQDLPGVELVFATATPDDEACDPIRRTMNRYPQVQAKLVHAGLPTSCSQQNNNQLKAAAAASPHSDVFVVIDSDIRLPSDYLSNLIRPLKDPNVMAATGYRWYSPPASSGLGSWLRSTWNAGALAIMPDRNRNFAWGGAMAFRTSDFSLATLNRIWGTTLDDDHTLTQFVRRNNGEIVFVPGCMALTHEHTSLMDTVRWTNRQTLITRIYNLPFWVRVLAIHGLQILAVAAGALIIIGVGLKMLPMAWTIMGISMQLPMLGMCLGASSMIDAMAGILPQPTANQARRQRWLYVVLTPMASLLCLWNSMASLLTSDMTWRGVTYRMVSAEKTTIIDGQ